MVPLMSVRNVVANAMTSDEGRRSGVAGVGKIAQSALGDAYVCAHLGDWTRIAGSFLFSTTRLYLHTTVYLIGLPLTRLALD